LARLSRPAYLVRRHIRNELRHRVHGKNWSWVRVAVGKGSRGWMGKGKYFAQWVDDHELLELFSEYERLSGHVIEPATHPVARRIRRALRRNSDLRPPLERLYDAIELEAPEAGIVSAKGTRRNHFRDGVVYLVREEGFNLTEVRQALLVEKALRHGADFGVPQGAIEKAPVEELTELIALRILSAFGSTRARKRPPVRQVAAAARYRAKRLVAVRNWEKETAEREDRFKKRQKWVEAGFPPTARTSSADQ